MCGRYLEPELCDRGTTTEHDAALLKSVGQTAVTESLLSLLRTDIVTFVIILKANKCYLLLHGDLNKPPFRKAIATTESGGVNNGSQPPFQHHYQPDQVLRFYLEINL